MSKAKERAPLAVLFTTARRPSVIPLNMGGTFNWGKVSTQKQTEESAKDDPMPGFVDRCMKHVSKSVSDPGAYCASVKDQITGTTHWRGKG